MDLHSQLTVSSLCSQPATGQLAVLYHNIWSGDILNIILVLNTHLVLNVLYREYPPSDPESIFDLYDVIIFILQNVEHASLYWKLPLVTNQRGAQCFVMIANVTYQPASLLNYM